ncbi:LysR family transcriptional regulator [Veillonella agrestimuris]|uniref:LysR family transcriptional regulator n=1 Tax=Veillonella agrestimuris TaxID=2941340 RepID=UPI00203CBC78|nr:LysR family transcriptional regulator [Veillonella agrestimuris]
MELRVLEYFVVTATEKSMTKAAQRLHITQPTLSIQLKELEEELGTTLLERTNRGIMLTHDGEYFFSKAKEILSLVSTTVTNLQYTEDITGELRLGGAETQHNEWLFSIIKRIQKDYPRVTLHFTSGNADNILHHLDTGNIEFAVTMGDVDTRKYNYLSLPYEDHWILLTHKDAPLAHHPRITKELLFNEPLIISEQTNIDVSLSEWFGRTLDEVQIVGTYNLLYNATLMVKAGIGSALSIDGIINTRESDLISIPLQPALTVPCKLIWKKNTTLSNIGSYFISNIQKSINE